MNSYLVVVLIECWWDIVRKLGGLREIVGLLSLPWVDRDDEGQTDKFAQSWSRSQISCC